MAGPGSLRKPWPAQALSSKPLQPSNELCSLEQVRNKRLFNRSQHKAYILHLLTQHSWPEGIFLCILCILIRIYVRHLRQRTRTAKCKWQVGEVSNPAKTDFIPSTFTYNYHFMNCSDHCRANRHPPAAPSNQGIYSE